MNEDEKLLIPKETNIYNYLCKQSDWEMQLAKSM